nr:glycoside hydrolase family 125 protein [Sphingomonas sp. CARO-RG-8B-R24-01]
MVAAATPICPGAPGPEDGEVRPRPRWRETTDAGTGFSHEPFDKDDPTGFSRPWSARANGVFGDPPPSFQEIIA